MERFMCFASFEDEVGELERASLHKGGMGQNSPVPLQRCKAWSPCRQRSNVGASRSARREVGTGTTKYSSPLIRQPA